MNPPSTLSEDEDNKISLQAEKIGIEQIIANPYYQTYLDTVKDAYDQILPNAFRPPVDIKSFFEREQGLAVAARMYDEINFFTDRLKEVIVLLDEQKDEH